MKLLSIYSIRQGIAGFMRNLILISFLMQLSVLVLAQKALRAGDKIPDISLGTVLNNNTGKTRFSELKGKLVILDFWSTTCTSCIEAFPHMEELQKKFGDKIQVFIVNTYEDQNAIEKELNKPRNKRLKLPDLPSIVNARLLGTELFPHVGVPFHVWIDPNGIVRVIGSYVNTNNEAKIQDVLDGKPITFLRNGIKYDQDNPFYSLVHDKAPQLVQYNSLFTRFTDTLANVSYGISADIVINKEDSLSLTVRNTFLNQDILQLYRNTIPDEIRQAWRKIIYPSPSPAEFRGQILLSVKDTQHYTSLFVPMNKKTDEIFREYSFCYEQVVPKYLPNNKRKEFMREDLNRYFGALYGMSGKIENKKINVYSIIRTSSIDKLRSKAKEENWGITHFKLSETAMTGFYHTSLRNALNAIIGKYFSNKPIDRIVIDESKYNDKDYVDFEFPENIKSMDELRSILNSYDLDIISKEIEWPMLVITENK